MALQEKAAKVQPVLPQAGYKRESERGMAEVGVPGVRIRSLPVNPTGKGLVQSASLARGGAVLVQQKAISVLCVLQAF